MDYMYQNYHIRASERSQLEMIEMIKSFCVGLHVMYLLAQIEESLAYTGHIHRTLISRSASVIEHTLL